MNTRDDSLKQLSNLLIPEHFAKILERNFSDRTLDFISTYAPTAEAFALSRYDTRSLEKLIDSMKSGLIDRYDVMDIVRHSTFSNRNEADIHTCLASIEKGMPTKTAVGLLIAENSDNRTFSQMAEPVQLNVYYVENNSVYLEQDIAREFSAMGVILTAERDDGEIYAVTEPEGHNILFENDLLAITVNVFRQRPDWAEYRDYLSHQLGENIDKLTPYILESKYKDFKKDKALSALADKVSGEYEQYISDLKKKDPDVIIRSAYEIYNKDYIADFCNTNDLYIDLEDIQVLLETDNVLDEIYQEWDSMTQLNGVAEIDTAIEDTAYRLKSARAVKQIMEDKQENKTPQKPDEHKRFKR